MNEKHKKRPAGMGLMAVILAFGLTWTAPGEAMAQRTYWSDVFEFGDNTYSPRAVKTSGGFVIVGATQEGSAPTDGLIVKLDQWGHPGWWHRTCDLDDPDGERFKIIMENSAGGFVVAGTKGGS